MFRMINIERDKRQKVLENKIDATNYMSFKGNRTMLIEYGIALGYKYPKPLEKKDALFRDSYIESNSRMKAILVALAVGSMNENDDLNVVLSADAISKITDESLNQGLAIIEDEIDTKSLSYDHKIKELDELYEDLFG